MQQRRDTIRTCGGEGGGDVNDTQGLVLFLVGALMFMSTMVAGIAWLELDGWQAVAIALPAIVLLVLFVILALRFTFA